MRTGLRQDLIDVAGVAGRDRGHPGGREQHTLAGDLDRSGGDEAPEQAGDQHSRHDAKAQQMPRPDQAHGLIELVGIGDLGEYLRTEQRVHGKGVDSGRRLVTRTQPRIEQDCEGAPQLQFQVDLARRPRVWISVLAMP
jgi:hypothetical protein